MKFIFGELNQGVVGTASVVIAAVLFIGIIAWVYRRSGKEAYQRYSELPLDNRNE